MGKMIEKRSKRSRLRFVVVSPSCMPAFCEKNGLSPSTCRTSEARANVGTLNALQAEQFFHAAVGRWTTREIGRTGRSRSYEDRWETAVYEHNMTVILTGIHAIFGLTQRLKTAS